MKYKIKRKRTVALMWLLTYAVLLIIPFLGDAYILLSVNSTVKKETESKYTYFLKSFGTNIDSALKDCNSIFSMVNENDAVKQMAAVDEVSSEVLYDLAKLGGDVGRIMGQSKFEEGFVYFPKIDAIVNSYGYRDAKDYFDSDKYPSFDYAEYKQLLKRPYSGAVNTSAKDENGNDIPAFLFTSVKENGYEVEYVIGVLADVKSFFGGEFDLSNGDAVVLKQRGDIYLSTDDRIAPAQLSIIKTAKPYEEKKIDINGQSVGVSYVKSEISNYRYVYIDRTDVYGTVNSMLLAAGLVSVICLMVMGLILYKLYNWNNLSLKEIMQGLNDESDVMLEENEFEFIKRRIEMNKQRSATMEDEISNNKEILREAFLVELMRGSVSDSAYITEQSERFGIEFKWNYFCITVISVQDMGILRDMSLKNTFYMIKNIMDDMCKNEEYCCAEYGDKLYYVFNFKKPDGVIDHLRDLLTESGEVTKMATEIVFSSVTSDVGEGVESLPHLYENAVSGMNLSEFYGMEEHVFKEDIEAMGAKTNADYFADMENELIVCIKNADQAGFERLLDKMFVKEININHRWVVMGRAYSVLNTIYKTAAATDAERAKEAFEMLNSFREYDNIGSIKKFAKEYGAYVIKMFDESDKEKSELYNKAIEYINLHYAEADLNVNKVSEALGVTSIYMAYVIKQNSGMRLSEYISKLRIERAKQLLRDKPELKVEQVAEQSGFLQNRTFYNSFKKYTGCTPNQYKTLNKEN